MGSLRYMKLEEFKPFKEFMKNNKKDFKTTRTSTTKAILTKKESIIFNETGTGDLTVLGIINSTKRDAKLYLQTKDIIPNQQPPLWYDITEKPPENGTPIVKIDIKSAYWKYAIDMGIISQKTNRILEDNYPDLEERKKARLKALGSLATRKEVEVYSRGVKYDKFIKENKETRALYIAICKGVDDLMSSITQSIDGSFYYYWDCAFARTDSAEEIEFYLKTRNTDFTVDNEILDVLPIGRKHYIQSTNPQKLDEFGNPKSKIYPIRDDDRFILFT